MDRVTKIAGQIAAANESYYNRTAEISDEEYDALKDELRELNPSHPILSQVGAAVSSEWQDREHNIPMSSLDKVNTIEEFSKWYKKVPKTDSGFSVQEKLDGISVSLDYENGKLIAGVTRGDGIVGEDITPNVRKMQGVKEILPKPFTGSIRGEIVLFKKDWEKHFPHMANPRNAAAGLARRQSGGGQEHLHVLCYDIVGNVDTGVESNKFSMLGLDFGLEVPHHYGAAIGGGDAVSDLREIYEEYESKTRESLPYEVDGLVIKVNDLALQEEMGRAGDRKNANPKGQVALKFAHEMRVSTVNEIGWQVGNTGRITPVAWIEPVQIAGVTVKKASLHNIENIRKLRVSIGAKVLVSRRNDVIPYVEKVIKDGNNKVEVPASCPSCEEKVDFDGTYLQCQNVNCHSRVTGNIEKWVTNLDIDEFGPKLIELLHANGLVKSVPDLYRLTVDQVTELDRMGETSAKKVLDNLHAKKSLPVHLVLGSLNIQGCGRRVFEKLVKAGYDSLDKIRNVSADELLTVNGIGSSLAKDITKGLAERSELIDELSELVQIESVQAKGGSLEGKSFCFTGTMERGRKALQQMVFDAGGEVRSSVNSGLDYLVISDPNSTSSKAQKARKLGTKLVGEQEFLDLMS